MVTQTLTKPAEGDTIYARKATGGATATATWEALVDMCNELAGRSGSISFENAASFVGSVAFTTFIQATQVSTMPAIPSAGTIRIYAKTDGNVVKLDSTGSESSLGGGGARAFLLMGG